MTKKKVTKLFALHHEVLTSSTYVSSSSNSLPEIVECQLSNMIRGMTHTLRLPVTTTKNIWAELFQNVESPYLETV